MCAKLFMPSLTTTTTTFNVVLKLSYGLDPSSRNGQQNMQERTS